MPQGDKAKMEGIQAFGASNCPMDKDSSQRGTDHLHSIGRQQRLLCTYESVHRKRLTVGCGVFQTLLPPYFSLLPGLRH